MLDESEKWFIERQWLAIRVIWGSLLAALVIYVILANVIGDGAPHGVKTQPGDPAWLVHMPRYVLGVMSLGLLALAWVIRRAAINLKNRLHRFIGS